MCTRLNQILEAVLKATGVVTCAVLVMLAIWGLVHLALRMIGGGR